MVDAAIGEKLLDELRGLLRTARALSAEQSRARRSPELLPESITAPMVRIHEAGSCRSSDLVDQLRISASVLSRHLAHAESLGYIDRCVDEYDRRASILTLSDTGRAALRRHRDAQLTILLDLLDDWNDEDASSLHHHLTRLRIALDTDRPARVGT